MENENIGKLDALIQEVEEELEGVQDDDEQTTKLQEKLDGLNSLKEDYSKKDEIATNYKTRAEKAEEELKGSKGPESKEKVETPAKNDLPQTDLLAILKADVHEDDIDEVLDYAKLKGISVKEALNTSVVRTILAERVEERTTAEATTTDTKRSTQRTTPTQILDKARSGDVPEDDDGIDALVNARFERK